MAQKDEFHKVTFETFQRKAISKCNRDKFVHKPVKIIIQFMFAHMDQIRKKPEIAKPHEENKITISKY